MSPFASLPLLSSPLLLCGPVLCNPLTSLRNKTIDAAASAGANMIVAGSSVFKAEDAGAAMRAMRESVVRLGHGGE